MAQRFAVLTVGTATCLAIFAAPLWGLGMGWARGGGYHPSGSSAGHGYSNHLPSDEGFHHASTTQQHKDFSTQTNVVTGPKGGKAVDETAEGPRGATATRGAAEGPRGGVAAGRGATGPGGTSVRQGAAVGPEGRAAGGTAVRGAGGSEAARGVAAGPNGIAAGYARTNSSGRYSTATAVRHNFDGYGMYGAGWLTGHPGAWYPSGWAAGAAWSPATWGSVSSYCGYADASPVYYDYGSNVVYQDGNVLVHNRDVGTAEQYGQQAADLATAGTEAQTSADEPWLPLGVFALVRNEHQESQLVVQLEVNKDGVIRGNYTDEMTDQTQPIHGSVDKKTQRAAWTIGSHKGTVFETGLVNLTKAEVPALIHKKDKTEQWLLVRLEQPAGGDQSGSKQPD
jgi:hypothetical protein